MSFVCTFCSKTLSSKQRLNTHIYAKHTPIEKKEDVKDIETIGKSDQDIIVNKFMKSITCKYCNKTFSNTNSRNRHVRCYCKAKKIKKEHNDTSIVNINIDKSKNTINIQQNNTITINAFGHENLDYITVEKLCHYIRPIHRHFNKLIIDIHANEAHPENHNIYLSSLESKFIKAFDGTGWNAYEKEDVLNKVLYKICELFMDNKEDMIEKTGEKIFNSLEKWIDANDLDDFKHLKIPLSLVLYNNKDIIKNTIKSIKN